MASDCFVSFRGEEDIAAIAEKARKSINIGNVEKLDVVGLIRRYAGKHPVTIAYCCLRYCRD